MQIQCTLCKTCVAGRYIGMVLNDQVKNPLYTYGPTPPSLARRNNRKNNKIKRKEKTGWKKKRAEKHANIEYISVTRTTATISILNMTTGWRHAPSSLPCMRDGPRLFFASFTRPSTDPPLPLYYMGKKQPSAAHTRERAIYKYIYLHYPYLYVDKMHIIKMAIS